MEKYESIKEWLEDVTSKYGKRNQLIAMKHYTDFIGMNPDELVEEAEREDDEIRKFKNRKIKTYLAQFKNHLESKYAPTTTKMYLTYVSLFYKYHEINIKPVKMEKKARPMKGNNKRIEDKGLIAMVLKRASVKHKAIILTIISSGLAGEDVRAIPLQAYFGGYDPETEVCTLRLRRHKTGVDFVTFLNPEATRAINDYLEIRRKSKDSSQQINHDGSGYLFILDTVKPIYSDPEYEDKHAKCRELLQSGHEESEIPAELLKYKDDKEEYRKYSRYAFLKIFNHLSDRCEITSPKGEFNVFRAHNLRKFFNQTMQNRNVNHILVETWMGHEIDATNSAYSQYSPAQLETYMSVMHHLYIDKQLDVAGSPEYQALEAEAKRLKVEAENNLVERYELSDLSSKYNRVLGMVQEMSRSVNFSTDAMEELLELIPEDKRKEAEEIKKKAHAKAFGDTYGSPDPDDLIEYDDPT